MACFQRTIDEFIRRNDLLGSFAYIDNITIAGSSQQEHDENLSRFLEAAKSKFTFNEDKFVFSIDLLGYTISHGTFKPDADRLRPLKELPVPRDLPAL
ncbi:pol Retrovirus-related Pol polyprotein from transposon-like 17 [Homarus americanus]|uniref:Pol Retrovirus-related Pol polyprotein from transposon-like 17 n=1 Tax=Homarus americanus TaxID=6706 RepID=A0A8J5NBU1_HOMAM|nr:pol Retrovirus-related Pol polyprotein from transposon-like 17 [Homarus americanus]